MLATKLCAGDRGIHRSSHSGGIYCFSYECPVPKPSFGGPPRLSARKLRDDCLGSHPVGDYKVANGDTSVARTLLPGKPQSPDLAANRSRTA